MSRVHVCDVCGKVITKWEGVTYKERITVCDGDGYPTNVAPRIKIEMCPYCHKAFKVLLREYARLRDMRNR